MNEITQQTLAKYIQYTNVRPDATRPEIIAHVESTQEFGFNAAMIAMCWVPMVRGMLKGTGIKVATCIGLGLGHESLHAKTALVRECLALGADEVDYGPNMGYFLSGMYAEFQEEARQIVSAASGIPVKAMLELGYIKDDSQRRTAARLLDEAGVPWVKNSSGWGPGSEAASPENIRLLRESVSQQCKVKASGKINTYEKAVALLDAGAELLGTSSGPQIIRQLQGNESGY
jgi:deoxyribose-phosphate aldolase